MSTLFLNHDIKKDIKELREVYEITGNEISISGDWNGASFKIFKKNKVLATIDVENQESIKYKLIKILYYSKI